jgi:hypothetical protein
MTHSAILDWAAKSSRRTPEEILDYVSIDELHDSGWSTFLPNGVRTFWPELTLDARIVLFVGALDSCKAFDADNVIA